MLGLHLLLHGRSLLRSHRLHLLSGRHGGVARLGSLRLHVLTVASLPHVVARTTTVVEGLLATSSLAFLTTVLVGALSLVALALLAISTAHLTAITHATTILIVALSSHAVKVLHEVLLHFIETALFTLLVQLLGGHPELN